MININKMRVFNLKKLFNFIFYSGKHALRVPSGLHFWCNCKRAIRPFAKLNVTLFRVVVRVLEPLHDLKFFFTTLIILFGGLFFKVSAQNKLYDSNDILEVISPEPNKNIKGQTEIRFKVFDNNQPTINYTLKLFDPLTCEDSYYGQVNTNLTTASSSDLDTIIKWNGISTTEESTLKDGRYCLNLCVLLKKSEEDYSACSARIITILNNNSLPQIKSSPSKTVINFLENFNYQIVAEDPDNDPIQYRLIQTPDFLEINRETGEIKSNSNKKISNTEQSVTYKVMVEATDNISGGVYQRFDLTVNGDGTDINSPTEISIIKPLEGAIVSGSNAEVLFQISDSDGIKKAVLEISNDLSAWKLVNEVTEIENNIEKTSNFNTSLFPDGEYYLKITAEDNLQSFVSKTSGSFFIRNNDVELKPQLTNLSPENLSVIYTNKPEIKGDIVKGISEIDINSFELKINSKQIEPGSCNITQTGFLCILRDELLEGRHNIVAGIKDLSGETAKAEWVFDIAASSGGVISILGRTFTPASLGVLFLIACLFAVILIVPWILYTLWKRQKSKVELKEDIEFENFNLPELPLDTNLPQTTITANYYNPENTAPAEDMQPSGWVQEEKTSSLPVIQPENDKFDIDYSLSQKELDNFPQNLPENSVLDEPNISTNSQVVNRPGLDSVAVEANNEVIEAKTSEPTITTDEYILPEVIPDLPVLNEPAVEVIPTPNIEERQGENVPVLDQYSVIDSPGLPNGLTADNDLVNLEESPNVVNNLAQETLPELEGAKEHVAGMQEESPEVPLLQPAFKQEVETKVATNNIFLEDYPELNFDEDFNLPPLLETNSVPETIPANENNLDTNQNIQTLPVQPAVVSTSEPEQQDLNSGGAQPQNNYFADLYPELTKEPQKEESGSSTISN